MAMLDGKKNKYMKGGNAQREKFANGGEKAGEKAKPEDGKVKGPVEEGDKPGDGDASTTITHHADGSHTVQHHDGETSEHPTPGHMLMGLHAKHADGDGMHVHNHGEGVTTHHVGMDGMVEGPHEHGSSEEAAEHMKQVLGQDGGNGSMEMSDGMPEHGMPSLY